MKLLIIVNPFHEPPNFCEPLFVCFIISIIAITISLLYPARAV